VRKTDLVALQQVDKQRALRNQQSGILRRVESEALGRGGRGLNTAPQIRYEPLKVRPRVPVGHHRDAASFIRDRRAGHDRPEAVRAVRLPIPSVRETYVPVPLVLTSDKIIQHQLDKWHRP